MILSVTVFRVTYAGGKDKKIKREKRVEREKKTPQNAIKKETVFSEREK